MLSSRPVALLLTGVAVALLSVATGLDVLVQQGPSPLETPVGSTSTPVIVPAPPPTTPSEDEPTYPEVGHRTYGYAPADPTITGHGGELLTYQVAVETDIAHLDIAAFAQIVAQAYGDPEGWTAGGRWRFQRVGPGQPADFVLYLVTPATRDALCEDGYDRYTSCRKDNRVVLNIARWEHGVPAYGASLAQYRQYMINHETGHRLGFGHELCPGSGQLAPVMEQQTLGLHGCVPNAWPYPEGHSYHGVSGVYPA